MFVRSLIRVCSTCNGKVGRCAANRRLGAADPSSGERQSTRCLREQVLEGRGGRRQGPRAQAHRGEHPAAQGAQGRHRARDARRARAATATAAAATRRRGQRQPVASQ